MFENALLSGPLVALCAARGLARVLLQDLGGAMADADAAIAVAPHSSLAFAVRALAKLHAADFDGACADAFTAARCEAEGDTMNAVDHPRKFIFVFLIVGKIDVDLAATIQQSDRDIHVWIDTYRNDPISLISLDGKQDLLFFDHSIDIFDKVDDTTWSGTRFDPRMVGSAHEKLVG